MGRGDKRESRGRERQRKSKNEREREGDRETAKIETLKGKKLKPS